MTLVAGCARSSLAPEEGATRAATATATATDSDEPTLAERRAAYDARAHLPIDRRIVSAVAEVHHLHIWGLGTTDTALTAHMVLATRTAAGDLLREINHELRARFGIGHATIQFESEGDPECESRECDLPAHKG